MKESTSKEKVLKKIRNALIYKSDAPYPDLDLETSVYHPLQDSLDVTFAEELINVGGNFVFCENAREFIKNLKLLLFENNWQNIHCREKALQDILNKNEISFNSEEDKLLQQTVGITFCEYLVSRIGAVMVSSAQASGRKMAAYPDVHIVVAFTSQLMTDLRQTFSSLKEKYESNLPSMITLITGPSRTADIEKTLVMGAHGPKELYVFLIDQSKR